MSRWLPRAVVGTKRLRRAAAVLVFAVVLAQGCGRSDGETTLDEVATVIGPEYSEGKGLHVPAETQASLGVTLADVIEEELAGTVEVSLRVYAIEAGRARAAGLLTQAQAAGFTTGQPLLVDAGEEGGARARVVAVNGLSPGFGGGAEIVVEIAEPGRWKVGSVVAGTRIQQSRTVMTVPEAAVIHGTDGTFVYTVSGGHFVRTHVQVGDVAGGRVEIRDGLYAGDQVVAGAAKALWLTELAAVKGGHACCVVPPKGK